MKGVAYIETFKMCVGLRTLDGTWIRKLYLGHYIIKEAHLLVDKTCYTNYIEAMN